MSLEELLKSVLNENDIDISKISELEEKFKEKYEELQSLKGKEKITTCEQIASTLPPIIKRAETIQVQLSTHQLTINNQLSSLQETIQEKYNVNNSDDLRELYNKTSNEYAALSSAAYVLSEELSQKINTAEEQYKNAIKTLNDLNK